MPEITVSMAAGRTDEQKAGFPDSRSRHLWRT